jgi:glutamate-1-semialdehyde aminotransferase/acyl carrier protein
VAIVAAQKESVVVNVPSAERVAQLSSDLRQVFESASGLEIGEGDIDRPYLELGLDSLFLTQAALAVQKKTGVRVTFRQLVEELTTLRQLAEYVCRALPADEPRAQDEAVRGAVGVDELSRAPSPIVPPAPTAPLASRGSLPWLIEQQIDLMQKQLAALQTELRGAPSIVTPPAPSTVTSAAAGPQTVTSTSAAAGPATVTPVPAAPAKPFGAMARISLDAAASRMSPRERARLEALTRRYTTRTRTSKEWTQNNRATMADPRVVTGFRPAIKELVYPIVMQRSAGARLWDLDGNEYIDCLNGFGCNLFGWQPEMVTRAIASQLQTGHEIGPQTPLAGDCARLLCEMTGFDRAAFCNTGSEAVLGTMRIARTVTGRSKIALFSGSYHGIFDEVIVRGTKRGTAVPAAPGVLPSTAENVLVLDYGTDEALAALRAQASDLAAVLVEPVQSRRPELQPREFLHELRRLTEQAGTVLIFDEVITGFRTCPGGAQEYFGVRADLASYGKVIGGGLPVGVIAGRRAFMDALDGGHWEFGDASMPTVGVTYFAGTFVRHPLALAGVKAVLTHLKKEGPALQRETNAKADRLAAELNAFFEAAGVPMAVRHFGSLWRTVFTSEQPWGDLLFVLLRDRGIHILDGFPCFFTTAHTAADVDAIVAAFKAAVVEMQESGFLPEGTPRGEASTTSVDATRPPVPGARLGRDLDGRPAWFVPNPNEPGKYLKLEAAP